MYKYVLTKFTVIGRKKILNINTKAYAYKGATRLFPYFLNQLSLIHSIHEFYLGQHDNFFHT